MLISHFTPVVGGMETLALQLGRGLVQRGYPITVVTQRPPGTAVCEDISGIQVHRVLSGRGRGIVYALTYLASLLRALVRLHRQYRVLHANHLYLEALGAALVGSVAKVPALAVNACGGVFGDFARLRKTRMILALPLLRRLDCVVALSREIRDELTAHGFAPGQIVQIPMGVDVERFVPAVEPGAARDQAGLGPETVLCLGRLDPQKGLEDALVAWAHVTVQKPAAQLVLVGDGPSRYALEAQARALGLEGRVRFLGLRRDPEILLQGSQVFLFPSRSEGMPNALLEAMATGLPCVASRIGGNSDLVEHGVSGMLIPPGDVRALAEAVITLLDDPSLRNRLGTLARRVAVEQYSMDRIVRQYAELYADLTGAHG